MATAIVRWQLKTHFFKIKGDVDSKWILETDVAVKITKQDMQNHKP